MIQTFLTKVKSGLKLIPQPNAYTCQAAAICMATQRNDRVMQVRQELEAIGVPGDPAVMGKILRRECPGKYQFDPDASLSQMRDWIKAGEFLIVHTWLSNSGHVICLNGVDLDSTRLSYKFHVLDPYSEFNAKAWAYNLGTIGYDGFYSSYLMYATAVKGQSCWDSERIYRRGELDSKMQGAWVHRIAP